jgi:hypothetical protein
MGSVNSHRIGGASTDQTSSGPLLSERINQVIVSTDPGVIRDRLLLATELAEFAPGGSQASVASQAGAGISGIAASANGIFVALTSQSSRVAAENFINSQVSKQLSVNPSLADFGIVSFGVEDLGVTNLSTNGGWQVSDSGGDYCTLNSTTYNYYLGVKLWYWLTAGHCSPVTPAHSVNDGWFNWQSGSATGASDSGLWYVGSGSSPPPASSTNLTDGFNNRWISTQSDRAQFDQVGTSQTCMTGAHSGTGCGTLLHIWTTPIGGTYYLRESSYKGCLAGDSGGPWFGRYLDGTVSLMGIEKGALTSNGDCVYSDLALALNDRQVSLYH